MDRLKLLDLLATGIVPRAGFRLDFVGSTRKDCERGSVFRLGFGFGWDKEVAPRPPRVKLDEREVFFVSLDGSIVFRLLE